MPAALCTTILPPRRTVFPLGSVFSTLTYKALSTGGQASGNSDGEIFVQFVNLPPVPTFVQIWNVRQEQPTLFKLTATDDHTAATSLTYHIDLPLEFRGSFSYVNEDQATIALGNSTDIPIEVRAISFTGPFNQWGLNFATFNVTIKDDDVTNPGITVVTVVINVAHVNKPPVIIPGSNNATLYFNATSTLTWNATDIDSPVTSLRGIINSFPYLGSLHFCIYNSVDGSCATGSLIVNIPNQPNFVNQTFPGSGQFKVVYVPQFGAKTTVIPVFYVIDDYNAPSAFYNVIVKVKVINQAPTLTVGGPFAVLQDGTQDISVGASVNDPDSALIKISLNFTLVENDGSSITLNSTTAFSTTGRVGQKGIPDCVQVDSRNIRCLAAKNYLKGYLPSLRFYAGRNALLGNHSVIVSVDDLGAGAEPEDVASSHMKVTGTITVVVGQLTLPIAAVKNNLTAAIAAGSIGGAIGAAAAVAAVARLIKKPDDEIFGEMLDFEGAAVMDNPLYEENMNQVHNALYED